MQVFTSVPDQIQNLERENNANEHHIILNFESDNHGMPRSSHRTWFSASAPWNKNGVAFHDLVVVLFV